MAAPPEVNARPLIERLREATELLESIATDRTVLAGVSDDDRARLLQAVARVYHPDRTERRRMAKVAAKERKAARVKETERARFETGIRELRRKPVYHSPNVFPPQSFEPNDIHRGPRSGGASGDRSAARTAGRARRPASHRRPGANQRARRLAPRRP